MDTFEPRHEGALQAYLRQAVMNRIRDEVRRGMRGPAVTELADDMADRGNASPLEEVIGREAVDRYEAALALLRPEEREAIVARVEMDARTGCAGAGAVSRRGANGREPRPAPSWRRR
jgi:DNA-directed RNA polymerase specialized sigma24 family protein